MFGRFKRARQQKAIRQALTAEFAKRGLDFASFDAIIQRTMLTAAVASGSVQEQVESFARVAAKISERHDLPDDLRRELVVKAYAEFGERLGKRIGTGEVPPS
jgi:hypothetical protein